MSRWTTSLFSRRAAAPAAGGLPGDSATRPARPAGPAPVEEVDGVVLLRSAGDDFPSLAEAAEVALAVGGEDTVTVLVRAPAPGGDTATHWARLGDVLDTLRDRDTDRVRLVLSGAGHDRTDRPSLARRIADAWELEVIAPDGAVLITPGGTLFVQQPAAPGGGWWSFGPGTAPRPLGRRTPAPAWQDALRQVPGRTSGGCVVHQIPAGVVIRPAEAPTPGTDDLSFAVPVHPERPLVLVGAPDAEDVAADEVATVLAALPAEHRARARLAPGGRRDLLRLAQTVADMLAGEVEVLTGIPLLGGDPEAPGRVRPTLIGRTGERTWQPYVTAVVCGPAGAGGRPPMPRPSAVHPALMGMPGGRPDFAGLTDGWGVAVTRAGLAVVPLDGPRPPVVTVPVDPDALTLELGVPGRPLDDSVLPALTRLLIELGFRSRPRTTLLVRGRLTMSERALRELATEHGISGIRYVTARPAPPRPRRAGGPAAAPAVAGTAAQGRPTAGPSGVTVVSGARPEAAQAAQAGQAVRRPALASASTPPGTSAAARRPAPDEPPRQPRPGASARNESLPPRPSPAVSTGESAHRHTPNGPERTGRPSSRPGGGTDPVHAPDGRSPGPARPGPASGETPHRHAGGTGVPPTTAPGAPDAQLRAGSGDGDGGRTGAPTHAPRTPPAPDSSAPPRPAPSAGAGTGLPAVPPTSGSAPDRPAAPAGDRTAPDPLPRPVSLPTCSPTDPHPGSADGNTGLPAVPPAPDTATNHPAPPADNRTAPDPLPRPVSLPTCSPTDPHPGSADAGTGQPAVPPTSGTAPDRPVAGRTPGEGAAPVRFRSVPYRPDHLSTADERAGFRALAAAGWERHAAAVLRWLTRMPGLRGQELEEARADLIALHAYLTDEDGPLHHTALVGDLRAGNGRLPGYAACLASALRRLPSYRGVVLRGAGPDTGEELPEPGALLLEPAPVGALTLPRACPEGSPVRYAIWSTTGRAVRQLLDRPAAAGGAGEIVFAPGSAFRVLGVRATHGAPVTLLRELPATAAVYQDGAEEELSGLDRSALDRLEKALDGLLPGGAGPGWPDRCTGPVGHGG
ncbi:hypothetical protein ACIF9R_35820 [Streptomyces sp. NPDC086080]|uniref:hypothetical protein n=1 Tax=Streptomyces sp. NPDC086080 TaxID=3365748 RepID=UPI0037D3BEC4